MKQCEFDTLRYSICDQWYRRMQQLVLKASAKELGNPKSATRKKLKILATKVRGARKIIQELQDYYTANT